jgi:phage shock protein E
MTANRRSPAHAGFALLASALLFASCSRAATSEACSAGPGTARELVAAGAQLLDVRTPEEHRAKHIEGSVNIPVQQLEDRLSELDRSRPVVVYCRSGRRSADATRRLCERGYRVHDLGPMSAW